MLANGKGITYVHGDDIEAIALTPAHLTHGRLLNTLPHLVLSEDELMDPTYENKQTLTKRSVILGKLFEQLRNQWEHEYLTALRERHDRVKTGQISNRIKPGDVVLVHSDTNKRVKWDLAVVESLIQGNDGIARAANIRTKNGRTNRPISKLYPLEVNENSEQPEDSSENATQSVQTDENVVKTSDRPKRTAAKKAELKIKNWICDLYVNVFK